MSLFVDEDMKLAIASKVVLCTLVLLMQGCGGSDSGNSSQELPVTLEGRFIGSSVQGLKYSTASGSGVTDSQGSFRYQADESISFSYAGIELGSVVAQALITAADLSAQGGKVEDGSINRLRLLQSVDEDRYIHNGIVLSFAESLDLSHLDLNFDRSLKGFEKSFATVLLDASFSEAFAGSALPSLVSQEQALRGFFENLACIDKDTDLFERYEPHLTTKVYLSVNVDADAVPPATRGTFASSNGSAVGLAIAGAVNGYPSEVLTFTDSYEGRVESVTTLVNASAEAIALQLAALSGVQVEANTRLSLSNLIDNSGTMEISINGELIGGGSLSDLALVINNATVGGLANITAIAYGSELDITSSTGEDISVVMSNTGDVADRLDVKGEPPPIKPVQLVGDGSIDGLVATVGGSLELTLAEGVFMSGNGNGLGLFASTIVQNPFIDNGFDPTTSATFNHVTEKTIYDSLGGSHILAVYFVKESAINTWTAHVLVDGGDVGDPNAALPPPLNEVARRAEFPLEFNPDGTLNEEHSDDLEISYWNPLDQNGDRTGAMVGLTVADAGGNFEVNPRESSNFIVDLAGSTQYAGTAFEVYDGFQNGHPSFACNEVASLSR